MAEDGGWETMRNHIKIVYDFFWKWKYLLVILGFLCFILYVFFFDRLLFPKLSEVPLWTPSFVSLFFFAATIFLLILFFFSSKKLKTRYICVLLFVLTFLMIFSFYSLKPIECNAWRTVCPWGSRTDFFNVTSIFALYIRTHLVYFTIFCNISW